MSRTVAYFSMEIALAQGMPTYSGGLGVLAGDTVRSAADLGVPMVAVTLLHRAGYFRQRLDADGVQTEEPIRWTVEDFATRLSQRVTVVLEGRTVHVGAWRHDVAGGGGHTVPVYLLDTDLPDNAPEDRGLTGSLYGGDDRYRLLQEAVLGLAGQRMLRALGHGALRRFHMNEGHSSLLTLALLEEHAPAGGAITDEDLAAVRRACVFTTHTPVPAGHDVFPLELARTALGDRVADRLRRLGCDRELNLTDLALRLSGYVNGVAKRHGEVSREMFPGHAIDSITNGVHAPTWTSPPIQQLFDRHIPGWRDDAFSLRAAASLPDDDLQRAHREAKALLTGRVAVDAGVTLDGDALTIGFARRMTGYKRPDLLFSDLDRLRSIATEERPLQIVYAGKAHPRDARGKEIIRSIFEAAGALRGSHVRVAYLAGYDLDLGRLLTGGVDVWLNNPEPPLEASGTSGMKAALNGVPSLSVLDGWWIEGCLEGVTGWAIGGPGGEGAGAGALYDKLEKTVSPCFYASDGRFADVMRHAIALNGSFFNTQRMVQQYVVKAYL